MLQAYREDLTWLQEDRLKELQSIKQRIGTNGGEIFDVSMFNPDLAPQRVLLDKLVEASLKPQNHRYSVSRGIRRLRDAFAGKYQTRFGAALNPESEICVTMGTKDAVLDTLTCLASPGKRVLFGAPTYPAHLSAARLAGLSTSFFDISDDEDRMLASIAEKLRSEAIAALVLNFPNNPTGVRVGPSFYSKLAALVRGSGVFVLNDFVYGEMSFDGEATSLLAESSLREQSAEVYSLSKAYSVPGWRVAALCGSARLVHQVTRLKAHVDYGIFLPIQAAASFALSTKEDLVKPLAAQYNNRCSTLAGGLRRLGWTVANPRAGACVWAKAPEPLAAGGSLRLAKELLSDAGVLAMPGLLFGERFDGYLRFAAVIPEERIRQALEQLSRVAGHQRTGQAAGM
ncbi:MAG: aminotransferase class I/II-fold pyridoxal phosphate-dependent enzyme [Deltaproteobacteria bacterium]|nr:aminotransferase class I/II-fold pyridoxal phosphate-dependent enzyme [Deltaproteobacteria bacterium]